jgi:hypothetical protein
MPQPYQKLSGFVLVYPLGEFAETADTFRQLMQGWLNGIADLPLTRLAFGAVLLQPVKSFAEGYERLERYLPFPLDSTNSSDFLYRINRSRLSFVGISDLKINRLSTWAVLRVQQVGFAFTLGDIPQLAPQSRGHEFMVCRLELDINTDANFSRDMNQEYRDAILDELIDLGKEIAEKGDTP